MVALAGASLPFTNHADGAETITCLAPIFEVFSFELLQHHDVRYYRPVPSSLASAGQRGKGRRRLWTAAAGSETGQACSGRRSAVGWARTGGTVAFF